MESGFQKWEARFQLQDQRLCYLERGISIIHAQHYSASFYFKPRLADEHEYLMKFVKLRQLELRANYGDHLGHEASLFRADFKEAAADAHSEDSDVLEASLGL